MLFRSLFDDLRYVLVTHCHADHLNMDSVKKLLELRPDCQFFGGAGCERFFVEAGVPYTVLEQKQEYAIGI